MVARFELRRKNEELKQQQRALQEANRTLETFAYNAAHDLKTPLNNIVGLTNLLDQHLPEACSTQIKYIVSHLSLSAERSKN